MLLKGSPPRFLPPGRQLQPPAVPGQHASTGARPHVSWPRDALGREVSSALQALTASGSSAAMLEALNLCNRVRADATACQGRRRSSPVSLTSLGAAMPASIKWARHVCLGKISHLVPCCGTLFAWGKLASSHYRGGCSTWLCRTSCPRSAAGQAQARRRARRWT